MWCWVSWRRRSCSASCSSSDSRAEDDARSLAPGRLVVGFGTERGYELNDLFADASPVRLRDELRRSSWDLRLFDIASTFRVAVIAGALTR